MFAPKDVPYHNHYHITEYCTPKYGRFLLKRPVNDHKNPELNKKKYKKINNLFNHLILLQTFFVDSLTKLNGIFKLLLGAATYFIKGIAFFTVLTKCITHVKSACCAIQILVTHV